MRNVFKILLKQSQKLKINKYINKNQRSLFFRHVILKLGVTSIWCPFWNPRRPWNLACCFLYAVNSLFSWLSWVASVWKTCPWANEIPRIRPTDRSYWISDAMYSVPDGPWVGLRAGREGKECPKKNIQMKEGGKKRMKRQTTWFARSKTKKWRASPRRINDAWSNQDLRYMACFHTPRAYQEWVKMAKLRNVIGAFLQIKRRYAR